ncbi:MAG: FecR domain-containing protein [Pseudobacter sp.]|uniref:FecR domain-containing protein n=1 Tax=Pseudobacter sp. TaxID=2045420 RepID=UPI003F809746
MNKEAVKAILEKALRHEATPEEYSELMEWMKNDQEFELSDHIGALMAMHMKGNSVSTDETYDYDFWHNRCLEIISANPYSITLPFAAPEKQTSRIPSRRKGYWAAAASILVVLGAAGYLWVNNGKEKKETVAAKEIPAVPDIQPGSNKAMLVLADGSNILLDSTGNGQIAADSGVLVNKAGGRLEYVQAGDNAARSNQFNILSTPRGGQYQLVLPDGTIVWLNAASSIKYPVAFPEHERMVEVTGEAYFEVKKDPNRPFIVKGAGQEVLVLGTSFNMNVYEDEPLKKITLIDGAVQVQPLETSATINPPRQRVTLKPGQQAKVTRATNKMDVVAVDTDEATSWKNGLFYTRKANIGELMRQIGRWFDVEVNLTQLNPDKAGPMPTFSGSITRNLTLSQIVKILELSDVKVKIEGKQITILP